jgi:hypothetical protein
MRLPPRRIVAIYANRALIAVRWTRAGPIEAFAQAKVAVMPPSSRSMLFGLATSAAMQ